MGSDGRPLRTVADRRDQRVPHEWSFLEHILGYEVNRKGSICGRNKLSRIRVQGSHGEVELLVREYVKEAATAVIALRSL